MKAVDIVATGLSGGFIALCIGIAAGMNGSLIAFATTIAGFLGMYLGVAKGTDKFMRWMFSKAGEKK